LNRFSGGSAIRTANLEKKKKDFALCQQNAWNFLSMMDIAMDRLCVAKTEQLLAERGRKGTRFGWQNSNLEFDATEPRFKPKRSKHRILMVKL